MEKQSSNAVIHLLGYLTEEQWLDAKERHGSSQINTLAKEVDEFYGTNHFELINLPREKAKVPEIFKGTMEALDAILDDYKTKKNP